MKDKFSIGQAMLDHERWEEERMVTKHIKTVAIGPTVTASVDSTGITLRVELGETQERVYGEIVFGLPLDRLKEILQAAEDCRKADSKRRKSER